MILAYIAFIKSNYIYNYRSQQLCAYLTHKLNKNRKELLDYFLDKIKKKNQRIYVYKIILKGLNILIDTMGSNIFDDKRSKP